MYTYCMIFTLSLSDDSFIFICGFSAFLLVSLFDTWFISFQIIQDSFLFTCELYTRFLYNVIFFFWYMNSFSRFVYFHVIFTHDSFLFTRYMIHLFHVNFDAHFISRDFYTQLFYLHMIHLFSREFWHMNHLISRDFYTQIFSFHMIHDSFIFT